MHFARASGLLGILALASCHHTTEPLVLSNRVVLISGENQMVLQHQRPLQPLVVRVERANRQPVPGVQVIFARTASQAGTTRGDTVVTDSLGLASWQGFLHDAGAQAVAATAFGYGRMSFTVVVQANGHQFDGLYRFDSVSAVALGLSAIDFLVADTTITGSSGVIHFVRSGSVDQVTGEMSFVERESPNLDRSFTGRITSDASGRVTATLLMQMLDRRPPPQQPPQDLGTVRAIRL